MNEPQSWVKPLTRIPSSLKPLVATQKNIMAMCCIPRAGGGGCRFCSGWWRCLSGFWSVKGAFNAGDARAVDDPRFSGVPLRFLR